MSIVRPLNRAHMGSRACSCVYDGSLQGFAGVVPCTWTTLTRQRSLCLRHYKIGLSNLECSNSI